MRNLELSTKTFYLQNNKILIEKLKNTLLKYY